MTNKVSILMGSKSDLDIMKKAAEMLAQFGIDYDIKVLSAHRTPHETIQYVETSDSDVFIAGAGGAAHLPGVVAGITSKPVIGVPVNASISIAGIDSLLSIVQMPPGVPVASVGVDAAKNAGILAAQMIAISNESVRERVVAFKKEQHDAVLASNDALV
ncbi:MAG: 5-(carboxyamino)imidazole ribonucleotide mutase [Candidatus Marinamargulisbacteria bacterium]